MNKVVFKLAINSIRYRKSSIFLSVLSIALSVALLLGIERVRSSVKDSFSSTISGTDLIVGARTGNLSLLLATVFHKGNVTKNISWESYENIGERPEVSWTIPISLGDSHKGFPVVATTSELFVHYKYGPDVPLSVKDGQTSIANMNCVIGSNVARELSYTTNSKLVLTHGMGEEDFISHKDDPFTVSGILSQTGTPIDNSIFVSLNALDHIHDDFYHQGEESFDPLSDDNFQSHDEEHGYEHHKHEDGHDHGEEHEHGHHKHEDGHDHGEEHEHDQHEHEDGHDHGEEHEHDQHEHENGHDHGEGHEHDHHEHENGHDHGEGHEHEHHNGHNHSDGHHHEGGDHPESITGFYLGLKNKSDILKFQRIVNEYDDEPILAILPAITLLELWSIIKPIENVLFLIALVVLLVSIGSVVSIIITTLNQRRREMSVLRSIGARPSLIFRLIIIESASILLIGEVLGILLLIVTLSIAKPLLVEKFGFDIEVFSLSKNDFFILLAIILVGIVIGILPAIRTYKQTLADGLTIKT